MGAQHTYLALNVAERIFFLFSLYSLVSQASDAYLGKFFGQMCILSRLYLDHTWIISGLYLDHI